MRYFKVPLQTIGAPIVNSILYLLIFGVSLGGSIALDEELPYLAFLIPGLIAMSFIKNAFDNATSAIMGQKYVNELQDLRVTPLSPIQILLAKTTASLMRGVIVGCITLIVGEVFYYIVMGKLLLIAQPVVLLYFVVLGGMAFASLGVAIGMWSRSFEHVGAVSIVILLPLIYLGGVFFSLDHVHSFWQFLSHANPLFYIINGVRHGILGSAHSYLSLSLIITMIFFLFCFFLSLQSLKKGSRYMR